MPPRITLVISAFRPMAQARAAALYAERPDDRRFVRTRRELRACLSDGHEALMTTDASILEIRLSNLRREFPSAQITVVNVDVDHV